MIEAVLERCAGLDVHQETVVACVLSGALNEAPHKEIRTFGTTTEELIVLGQWIVETGCSHIAMESTGVYWKPIWNVLEAFDFEMLLANAHHIKNLPGRKTDMKDAEWIAKLLRSGLIEGSFVPSPEVRDLRDLTRYRKKLVNKPPLRRIVSTVYCRTLISNLHPLCQMSLASPGVSYFNKLSMERSSLLNFCKTT